MKTGGIDARANTQINIVNDSPMLMNVNDAVVMDGTIIRPGSDGEMKIFKSGHLYINDASVKGATGSDVAEVRVLQLKNGWAADPFGGALDAEMMALVGNAPVDLNLLGAVVNPLGKVSVVNTLGSINVTGTISALSLDIQARATSACRATAGSIPAPIPRCWRTAGSSSSTTSRTMPPAPAPVKRPRTCC